ncbi:MAG: hypothetical protein ABL996_23335, partial [Micropepsaceae bacterium]
MTTLRLALCATALGVLVPFALPARAADDADLAVIRKEMKALRGDYDRKLRELEKRLQKAEQRADAAEAQAAKAPSADAAPPAEEPVSAPPAPRAAASANAFNPAISVILNGSYAVSDDDPAGVGVRGFALGDEAGLPDRGFSLGESELAISASVDQWFLANLIVAIGNDDSIGVEEGYVQTTDLPWGLTVKAGRFFSGIGYL